MNRSAAYRLVRILLFVGMLTFILYPIHATPVKRTLETIVEGESLLRLGSISQTPEWNQTYGGIGWDEAYSVVETGDGGYAIAGETHSFGAGSGDFWLVKTDGDGNMEWNQTYGGRDGDRAWSIVETGDGGYAIAGDTSSFGAGGYDFWLVKTDGDGNMEWNQTYGGRDGDRAWSIVETGDGGYALAGVTTSYGAGPSDFWLVKTDAAGNVEWNQTYGGTNSEYAHSVVETSDRGYAIAGYTNSLGAGDYDFWLVKTEGREPEETRIFFNVNPNPALAGQVVFILGNLATSDDGPLPGEQVTIARNGTPIADFTTNSTGWFRASGQAISAGTFNITVKYAGSMQYLPSSDWEILVVHKAETEIYTKLDPNPATIDQPVTLKGILVDEFSQPLAAETVRLYARPLAGDWRYITSLTTNSYGVFTWQATIPEVPTGTYILATYYPGSEAYESSYNFAILIIQ